MRKLPAFLAALVAVSLCAASSGSQIEPAQRAIRLRFPDRADLTGLSIHYFLVGPFGGFGGLVQTRPDVREYSVATWHEGQQAASFKAIVYCPGYQTVLLTESELAGRQVGTISVALEPLRWLSLSGRLISRPAGTDVRIEASYLPFWSHTFFGIVDGFVPSFLVDTAPIGADGAFVLRVPDFIHDPVETSFGDGLSHGEITLRAREAATGNIPFELEEVQQAGQSVRLRIAAEYPDLMLVGIRR